MNLVRGILIVVAAIVVAIIALKLIAFVTSLMMGLVTLAIIAGVVYVLFLMARSAIGGRTRRV